MLIYSAVGYFEMLVSLFLHCLQNMVKWRGHRYHIKQWYCENSVIGDKLTGECYRKDAFLDLGCVEEDMIKYITGSIYVMFWGGCTLYSQKIVKPCKL